MSTYLDRLKQLESEKNSTYILYTDLSKLTKVASGCFGSTTHGVNDKKNNDNKASRSSQAHKPTNLPATISKMPGRDKILTMGIIAPPESELKRLVWLVSDHHSFSQEDYEEALIHALRDPVNALTCFPSLARQAGLSP